MLDDLEKLTYATYLCELIDISLIEEETNRELFKSFVSALYFMDSKGLDDELIAMVFELKMLKLTGYGIELNNCVFCREPLKECNYINLPYLGGVCDGCNKINGIPVSKGTFSTLRFLNNTTFEKVCRLNPNKNTRMELREIITLIIENNYARKPKSLEMLNIFEEDV